MLNYFNERSQTIYYSVDIYPVEYCSGTGDLDTEVMF